MVPIDTGNFSKWLFICPQIRPKIKKEETYIAEEKISLTCHMDFVFISTHFVPWDCNCYMKEHNTEKSHIHCCISFKIAVPMDKMCGNEIKKKSFSRYFSYFSISDRV